MERDPERDQQRESWGKSGELLDRIADDGVTVGRERLEEIATAALAGATSARPARVRLLPRLVAKLAAAAGLLIAISLGVHYAMNPSGNRPAREPELVPLPPPACLEDPDFVTNFDVIRDLPELDADGDLLDVDDDVLLLQALEGA